MKMEWKDCRRLVVSGLLLYLAIHYWSVLAGLAEICIGASAPLILGFMLAYMVNIPMTFFEHKLKLEQRFPKLGSGVKPLYVLLTLAAVGSVLFLVGKLVVPELVRSVRLMYIQVSSWAQSLDLESVGDLNKLYGLLPQEVLNWLQNTNWENAVKQAVQFLTHGVGGTVNWVVSAVGSVFSTIVTWALALVFALYLLLGRDTLLAQGRRLLDTYLRPKDRERVHYVFQTMDECFHGYIVGRCFDGVILGVLCILGMTVLRLPFALAIGTLVGVTALIPIAGAYIGAVVGALLILTISPMKALIFVIFLVILQQLEGNLIYPKLVGTSIGLPGVWVLAAITVGGGMLGIVGMLLSVPIVATLYRLLQSDIRQRSGKERAKKSDVRPKE